MRRYITLIIFFLVIIFAIFYIVTNNYFYQSTKNEELSIPSTLKLKDGDIIFRKEANYISDIFSKINNSKFSHLGTIILKNKEAYVIHIEDLDVENDFQIIKANQFIKYATAYSIYRPFEKIKDSQLMDYVKVLQKENPKFDLSFGKNKDNSIYCTELALKIYNKTHNTKILTKKVKYLNYEYIPLSIFYKSKLLKPIFDSGSI